MGGSVLHWMSAATGEGVLTLEVEDIQALEWQLKG